MKSRLIATAVMLAVIAQAPAFAASGLATPTKQSHVKLNCFGPGNCNQVIAYCIGKGGNWNPGKYNKEGQPITGNCTGL